MIGCAHGTIVSMQGGLLVARLPATAVGSDVIITSRLTHSLSARVIGAGGRGTMLVPFGPLDGIRVGDRVQVRCSGTGMGLGFAALGRAIGPSGEPLDGRPPLDGTRTRIAHERHAPGLRMPIRRQFTTGLRAIDGPLAFGVGARIGIFGGPGCGKSTLLEAIVAGSNADVCVVALVGERGREAQRWLARNDPRTTIVCATSERSPAERVRAMEIAVAQADALRRGGLDVLLVIDSLARVAAAARDVAVAAGEPVGRGGYPPSVYGLLAQFIERAGNFTTGSITLVATVLSDGADEHDPVSEACRAALDGHISLSQRLARQGWFPAIDLPASASRTFADVADGAHHCAARSLRRAIVALDETREARAFGLDPAVGDTVLQRAVAAEKAIAEFLRQVEPAAAEQTLTQLQLLSDRLE